jgi:CheY-like chemotaxis protein
LQPLDIFLIEDNPGDVVLFWHVLAESGMKVKVHLAVDGKQALQMLTEPHFKPSLIVLDLNIPKDSWIDFTRTMVRQNAGCNLQFHDGRTTEATCCGIGSTRVCFEILGSRGVYRVCLWNGTQVGYDVALHQPVVTLLRP